MRNGVAFRLYNILFFFFFSSKKVIYRHGKYGPRFISYQYTYRYNFYISHQFSEPGTADRHRYIEMNEKLRNAHLTEFLVEIYIVLVEMQFLQFDAWTTVCSIVCMTFS